MKDIKHIPGDSQGGVIFHSDQGPPISKQQLEKLMPFIQSVVLSDIAGAQSQSGEPCDEGVLARSCFMQQLAIYERLGRVYLTIPRGVTELGPTLLSRSMEMIREVCHRRLSEEVIVCQNMGEGAPIRHRPLCFECDPEGTRITVRFTQLGEGNTFEEALSDLNRKYSYVATATGHVEHEVGWEAFSSYTPGRCFTP